MKTAILLLFLALGAPIAVAQNEQMKAFHIFNFIRYVDWTEAMRQGNFIISVVGNREVAQHLRSQTAGRRFGHQNIEVREYAGLRDVGRCHVLFIGSAVQPSGNANGLISHLISTGTLIITESERGAPYGSSINFVTRQETLHFELNSRNASRAGLKFSSRLTAMSTAINL